MVITSSAHAKFVNKPILSLKNMFAIWRETLDLPAATFPCDFFVCTNWHLFGFFPPSENPYLRHMPYDCVIWPISELVNALIDVQTCISAAIYVSFWICHMLGSRRDYHEPFKVTVKRLYIMYVNTSSLNSHLLLLDWKDIYVPPW